MKWTYSTLTCGLAVAAILATTLTAPAQIVTTGLILNLEAGNNLLHPDSRLDLSARNPSGKRLHELQLGDNPGRLPDRG